MNLIQEKLDVISKKRANLFNWRGQFTPDFVEYILDSSRLKLGSLVADPFAGSGTVLIESATQTHSSLGFEINPAAFQMASFYKYSNLNLAERHDLLFSIGSKLSRIISKLNGQLIYCESKDYRTAHNGLIEVAQSIKAASSIEDVCFFMNMLFMSEKDTKLTIKNSLQQSFFFFKRALLSLPYNQTNIQVHNEDARSIGDMYLNQVDLILTSPPYINVFNYHQNYRAVTETFDYDILGVAHSEFGSNRKNRGNRLLTVVQYCMDMEASLVSFWKSLKDDAKMVMVVGRESNVRKTPFYNGKIVLDLLQSMNGFKNINCTERSFTNKFGKRIIEDIIILDKDSIVTPSPNNAQNIAREHLKIAYNKAPEDVVVDFENVMERINDVKPSPIFNA